MYLVLSLFILFGFKKHRKGFSSEPFLGAYQVYFFSQNPQVQVFVDGQRTGINAPGLLYFPSYQKSLFVEYRYNGITFFSKQVELLSEKSLVMGQITPVINLLANCP